MFAGNPAFAASSTTVYCGHRGSLEVDRGKHADDGAVKILDSLCISYLFTFAFMTHF